MIPTNRGWRMLRDLAPTSASRVAAHSVRVVTLLLILPVALAAQGLTAEQVADLQLVSAVAMSPDGERVAYTVTTPRTAEDPPGRPYSELRVVPAAGGEPRAVVERPGSALAPAWSPDGRLLAFLSRIEEQHEVAQVYAVPAEGGEVRRLTSSPEAVMAFAWSPDGAEIAYTAREAVPPELERRRERGYDMVVTGEDILHVRLWMERAGEGGRRAITPGDRTVWAFAWHPGGDRVAVQASERPGADADLMFRNLYIVQISRDETRAAAAEGGDVAGAMEILAPTAGKLDMMAWSPDGAHLAFLGATAFNDPLAQSVFVVDAAGGEARNLTPGHEGSAEWVGWADANTVLFAGAMGTRSAVHRVPAAGGEPERILGGGAEIIRRLSLDRRAERFAAPTDTREHPPEAYVGTLRPGAAAPERITFHNGWLADVELVPQETIEWTAPDGMRIEGILYRPLGVPEGERAPLAILPHGGPEAITVDGWRTRALYPAQYLAANGYAVLKPNYRGSGGRGVAFSIANHRDLGGAEFEDVLAGIDHLAELGLVDPDRVGISGTSYGGYFSAWGATRHADRFRAAITFAGLSNWISFTGTTDIPVEMSAVHWDLWWFDNPGQYWDRSPVAWLAGPNLPEGGTPILVAHGLADERVHPEQSIQLHQFLQLLEIPTGLVLYPREPHGLLERAHQLDFMERVLDWFDRHVRAP